MGSMSPRLLLFMRSLPQTWWQELTGKTVVCEGAQAKGKNTRRKDSFQLNNSESDQSHTFNFLKLGDGDHVGYRCDLAFDCV
jgi:hypothetical protein